MKPKWMIERESRTFNIIVYDETQTESPLGIEWSEKALQAFGGIEPGSLTWWWKKGELLQRARGWADVVIPASTWIEAFREIVKVLEGNRTEKPPTIQFWGHGRSGAVYMGKTFISLMSILYTGELHDLMKQVWPLLDPNESWLWWRACSVFHGSRGQNFAEALRDIFRVSVCSHTYLVTYVQSGLHCLSPDETPDWPISEGGENEKTGMSRLWAPNTVFATEFFPRLDW